MKIRNCLFLGFLFFTTLFFSQRKEVKVDRISDNIKVDGNLNEKQWENAFIASDFIETQPNNGQVEKTNSPTKVKILYDDTSLYFGIELVESNMDSINTRLSNRDAFSNAEDWIMIALNPFNDNQQYFEFGVTAAGVQFDAFGTQSNGEDWSWNAIWDSAVEIEEGKWVAEFKIPYSAIRFPKEFENKWSVNFVRNYGKNRKKFSWERVNNEKGNFFQYNGDMVGIEGINPPTRLFFIPYVSDYLTRSNGKTHNSIKGGMDLNWGINESYTLDAILIPDFGQTEFDEVRFVLGPFEQQFSDKRPFFTEGTDLFNKGGLLYTRRIGQAPSFRPKLDTDEEITNYPSETRLINAMKVSGRGKSGLGIGVLNAITNREEAEIYNVESQENRKAIVSPYTNYNVLVFDQRLKESSSSIALVNTSTIRNGSFRDANVSALVADLFDKENKYNLFAQGKYSYVHDQENTSGYNINGSFSKQFGKNRYGFGGGYVSEDYDINDLGINFYSNYNDFYLYYNNRLLESNEHFNTRFINHNLNGRFDNQTGKPYYFSYNFNFNSTNKKNNFNGFGLSFSPLKTYDFYEPRVAGRYSENPKSFDIWYSNSPNYSKKFLIDKEFFAGWASFRDQFYYGLSVQPRYRPSDKVLLTFSVNYDYNSNDRGWVNQIGDDIIFGDRNRRTLTTNINGQYYFNALTSLSLNFRHYYTNADYQGFHTLNEDGSYTDDPSYQQNHDFTFNTWNMDLKFSWWFAPGSQMEILYRNTLDSYTDLAQNNLPENFQFLFEQPITQILSFRVTYFLDYNKAQAFFKRKRKPRESNQQAVIESRIKHHQQRSR